MAQLYCGNNALHPDLVNGTKMMGTKYQCLRKGIGTGLNLPYDADYGGPYTPIDDRKIYCGDEADLPDGYDRMGNSSQCLQKGIGIGKIQRAQQEDGSPPPEDLDTGLISHHPRKKRFSIFITVCILIFIVMYIVKPNIVTKLDNNKIIIIWPKFFLWYIIIVLLWFFLFSYFSR